MAATAVHSSSLPTKARVIVTFNGETRKFKPGDSLGAILRTFYIAYGVLVDKRDPSITFRPEVSKGRTKIPAGEYNIEDQRVGLPPLGKRTASSSGTASYSMKYEPVTIRTGNFTVLDGVEPEPFFDLWSSVSENGLNWSSEHSIQNLVTMVLKELFAMLEMSTKLDCVNELSVFQLRPDIWIVRSEYGIPIGVVEVKKPNSNKRLDTQKVGRQLYNYLLRLKSFHGLKHVFGIVTTYEEWQILWLDDEDTNTYAQSSHIDRSVSQPPPQVAAEEGKEGELNSAEVTASQEGGRKLCATDAIRYDNPALTQTLLSVLLKMYNSPLDPVLELSNDRPYIILDEDSWYWGKVSWKNQVLNRHKLPNQNCKRFILLRDLRGGADGRVWMACSVSGLVCVLKFGRVDSAVLNEIELQSKALDEAKARLTTEMTNYAKQDSEMITRVIMLAQRPVLMMRHYSPVDFSDPGVCAQVKSAVVKLARERHLQHKDMKRDHVVRDTPTKKIRFIDMAEIQEIDNDQVEGATNQMLAALKLEDN